MNASRRLAALVLALSLPAGTAAGATLAVPGAYETIQLAVDAASPGDTVLVAPGTYSDVETRVFQAGGTYTASSMLFMKAGVSVISEAGPGGTTLDMLGQGTGDVIWGVMVEGQSSGPLHLEGFRMVGVPVGHTGLFCRGSAPMTVRECVFDGLAGGGDLPGGAYAVLSTSITFLECAFLGCSGGEWPREYGGVLVVDASILAEDCVFEGCSGGIAYTGYPTSGPSGVFRRCRFEGNTRRVAAGLGAAGPNVVVEDCLFRGNTAEGNGAASVSSANFRVERCTFVNNTAEVTGGLSLRGDGVLQSCTFVSNTNEVQVGGTHLSVREGPVEIRNCVFASGRGSHGVDVPVGGIGITSSCNVFWDNPLGHTEAIIYPWSPTDTIQDPQFCDVEAGDYRVNATSPCLPGSVLIAV
jgi:hypothetical protein